MQKFRKERCCDIVTAKIHVAQRAFLEKQALARDVSLCDVIRDLIDAEMVRTGTVSMEN
jgi:hypothetical protein